MKYIKVIIAVSLLSSNLLLHAQTDLVKNKASYTININDKDGYSRILVFNKNRKIKPQEKYTYYWYAYNKVMVTKGGYDGRLLHGEFASFYENNNLKEKGYFKKGLKNGEWMAWFDNGKIKEVSHWKNSLRNGNRKVYNEKGELVLEENYKNDTFNGTVTKYDSGKAIAFKYYKNGIVYEPKEKRNKKDTLNEKSENNKNIAETNQSQSVPTKKSNGIFAKIKGLFSSKKNDSIQADSDTPQQPKN
jgi:antitoxin component YwqK of YwqJK toxin-antitoxin module